MTPSKPFPDFLAKPAQRALANAGITSLEQLASYREEEIAELHDIGKNALAKLKEVLIRKGLQFKN